MRIMLLAAAAALSLGVGSAYADKERTAPLPSPSAEVADNTLDSGAKAVISNSVDLAPVQKAQPVVPAAKGRRQDGPWILRY